jgi:hypothetical protein
MFYQVTGTISRKITEDIVETELGEQVWMTDTYHQTTRVCTIVEAPTPRTPSWRPRSFTTWTILPNRRVGFPGRLWPRWGLITPCAGPGLPRCPGSPPSWPEPDRNLAPGSCPPHKRRAGGSPAPGSETREQGRPFAQIFYHNTPQGASPAAPLLQVSGYGIILIISAKNPAGPCV